MIRASNPWFESLALPSDDVLAACRPSLQLGRGGMIDIVSLAAHPLLLLDSGYSVRRLFNAACRVADVEPNILLESRAPHTLLALAEAGQGMAIIPSVLRTDRYRLKIARVTHRRKPLRDRYVIQWDKRRPMPSYAQNFCAALAAYMREVLPIATYSFGTDKDAKPVVCSRRHYQFQPCPLTTGVGAYSPLMCAPTRPAYHPFRTFQIRTSEAGMRKYLRPATLRGSGGSLDALNQDGAEPRHHNVRPVDGEAETLPDRASVRGRTRTQVAP